MTFEDKHIIEINLLFKTFQSLDCCGISRTEKVENLACVRPPLPGKNIGEAAMAQAIETLECNIA